MEVPKTIWIFWYQGINAAPNLIRTCVLSWQIRNPDFSVIFLDGKNIADYISIPAFMNMEREDLSIQMYADFVRLALLKKYGGIWVDANIYCFQPLNKWLPKLLTEDIFLFSSDFKDRLNANWFIAASRNHYLIQHWQEEHLKFFKENRFMKFNSLFKVKLKGWVFRLLKKNSRTTEYWFSFFIKKILNIYPYFVMHYLFNQLYHNEPLVKKIWDNVPIIYTCKIDMRCRRMKNLTFKNFLMLYQKNKIPLLKMTHRNNTLYSEYNHYLNLVNSDFKILQKINN